MENWLVTSWLMTDVYLSFGYRIRVMITVNYEYFGFAYVQKVFKKI